MVNSEAVGNKAALPNTASGSDFVVYSEEQAFLHLTKKRSKQEYDLYMFVDEILFNVWDALCLSIDNEYREAYLPYLPHTFELLRDTEDGQDLYEYLVQVEENQFGADPKDILVKRRAASVVEILLEFKQASNGTTPG